MFSGSEQRESLSSVLLVSCLSPVCLPWPIFGTYCLVYYVALRGFAVFMLLSFAPGRAEAVVVKPPFSEVLPALHGNQQIANAVEHL